MTATLPSPTATPEPAPATRPVALIAPALAGGAVALALGVYGRAHHATGRTFNDLGFPSLLAMKSWLATIAVALALFQLASALRMYGRLHVPRAMPRWLPAAHRWSGARPLIHGLLGCAFYGAITTKLLALRTPRLPRWAIPVVGATIVTALVGVWLTSALWFFATVDFPAL